MELSGQLTEIIYQNEVNSYLIGILENEEDTITIVGYMPFLVEGCCIPACLDEHCPAGSKTIPLLTHSPIYQAGSFLRMGPYLHPSPDCVRVRRAKDMRSSMQLKKLRQGHWIRHWMWNSFTDRKEALQLL